MNRRSCFALPLIVSSFLPAFASAQTVIPAGTGNFNANTSGVSYQLNAGDTRSVTSGTTETISIGGASGTYTLTVNGTVSQTVTGRGIRTSNNNVTFNVTIGATGLVKAVGDDAFQARNGTVNLTNFGTLYSGADVSATPSAPSISGRGINVRDASGGVIVNGAVDNTTALIRSDGNDAVRVGSNFSFTNYGVILANGVVNDNAGNNAFNPVGGSLSTDTTKTYTAGAGFSFEDASGTVGATNSSLTNYGTISGARHGVQAGVLGSGLTVTNMAGGQIIGRNGSGVGFDTTTTDPSKIVVYNSGLIRGDYVGSGHVIDQTGALSPTQDGDGDGIDIDGAATIRNYATGQIISTGAGGFDTNGRANNSEAISIGGGVIVNDGVIRGADRGIVVNNDSVASRSGVAATTITNNTGATIEGQNGFAIRLENKLGTAADNDTITNAGTIIGRGTIPGASATVTIQGGAIDTNSTGTLDGVTYTGTGSSRFISGDGSAIQMGEGADVLNNTGTIIGMNGLAINMEGGDDIVNFDAGTITGTIDGGEGNDTLNLGAGVSTTSAVARFEQINVASGTAALAGVVSGTTLTKGGAGTLVLSSANTTTGLTTVAAGILRVNNLSGSATGSGNVIVNSGATLAGTGIVGGNVTFNGLLSPGDVASLGTLTVNSNVTWNGGVGPANAWQFGLGAAGASDRLLVGGDFLKGTPGDFVFDFQSGATTGTFILVDWTGTTTFTAGDFSYVNLADGLTGTFAFNGSQLEFTTTGSAVPEPSTYAAIFGAAVLGLAFWRRRQKTAA